MRRARSILSAVFAAFWTAALFSSLALKCTARFFDWPACAYYQIKENRELEPFPDFRALPLREWGKRFDAWYDDHFACRAWLIDRYRKLHFEAFRSPVLQQVPGKDGWVFHRGGNWAEVEDYLGALELTGRQIDDWLTLFEGRTAWCEAHGVVWLYAITPVKAQIHPDAMFPMLARHRGKKCIRQQVAERLADSPARDHVLFLTDVIERATREKPVFYKEDHHVNGYGTWLMYDTIVRKLRDFVPALPDVPPMYDTPPPDAVERGEEEGCFVVDNRLCVRVPGRKVHRETPFLKAIGRAGGRSPQISVGIGQDGARRTLVMANDSFMRFSLAGWHFEKDKLALPFGKGFDRVYSLLFVRFTTRDLEKAVALERPAVLVEQFPEIKLAQEPVGLDDTMRRAAAWLHAKETDALPEAGDVLVLATLENVEASPGAEARLVDGTGAVLARLPVESGSIRALFFPPVPAGGGVALALSGATAETATLRFRVP